MKIRGFVAVFFAVAFSFAPQFVDTSSAETGAYSAKLISPTVGQVLRPGQTVRVEWKSNLPKIDFGAAGHSLRGLARGCTRKTPNISIGLFRSGLHKQRFWTFASDVNRGIPKAMLHSLHRPL